MPTLREYVRSSEKDGYYINEKYKNKFITYQVPKFAKEILINLGYDDGDAISYEVFYILLNLDIIYTGQSGIKPVDSLEELPDFESDKMDLLSPEQRTRFLDMLRNHDGITQQQRKELDQYADLKETTTQYDDFETTVEEMLETYSNNSEEELDTENNDSIYDGRNEDYDNYWLAVDLTRFLGQILKESDATVADTDKSGLAREYIKHRDKKGELKEVCQQLPGSLPKYREAVGIKNKWKVVTKTSLEESGIRISSGNTSLVVKFDFKPYHDDIALPDGYEVPNVWSETEGRVSDETTIDDLPEEMRRKLLQQARSEIIGEILETERRYNEQINSARNKFIEYLESKRENND